MDGEAQVSGYGVMTGDGRVDDTARLEGNAFVGGNVRAGVAAHLHGDAVLNRGRGAYDDADLFDSQHLLTLGPIGSAGVEVTLYRTKDGHRLSVGCWSGRIDELPAEVERRKHENWVQFDDEDERKRRKQWESEYLALIPLLNARVAGWH